MSDGARVAVVTGANRGLGFEAAKQLAKRGMHVIATARDADKGEAARQRLAADGAAVTFRTLDVTDEASVVALAQYVAESHGRLDVLVNNAGACFEGEQTGFFDVPPDMIRRSFETNAMGAVLCCRALVPLMQKAGYGRVVNVSSGMAALGQMGGGYAAYRIGKVGLHALTRTLGHELEHSGIKVNAMCPGSHEGETSGIEGGVDTMLWLATLRDDGPTGGFFRDCKAIDW